MGTYFTLLLEKKESCSHNFPRFILFPEQESDGHPTVKKFEKNGKEKIKQNKRDPAKLAIPQDFVEVQNENSQL